MMFNVPVTRPKKPYQINFMSIHVNLDSLIRGVKKWDVYTGSTKTVGDV